MADLSILVKILAQNSASGALHAVHDDLGRLGVQSARTGGLLGTVAGVGMAAVAGAGLAVAGGIGFAVKQAMDFESVISGVGAVSGATTEELGSLSAMALQIGKDTKFTATEAGMAMEELVKAGISVEDILNGAAGAAVNLAAAGATSIPSAAAIMAGAMNAFNIAGTESAHVADIITGAANASTISVEEFGIGFGQLAAVANLTGFSLEDSATALALVTKAGISASDAGTSLKTMFLQLNPQTNKARDLMRDLGIITRDGRNQFFNAQGEVRSLAEVSQVLTNALSDLTDEDRILALKQLFGQDAVRAGAILFQQGADGVNAMKSALEDTSAAEVAEKRMNNLTGSLEKMWGSISTVAISLGLALTPALKVAVDGFTEMINAAIPWIEQHGPAIAQRAMEMVAAFIPWVQEHAPAIIQGFKDFATRAFDVIGKVLELTGKFNEFLEPIGGLTTALPILIGLMGVSGLLGAFSGLLGPLGVVVGLLGGPLTIAIVLVGLAIGGLAIAWANDWMSIRTNTRTAVNDIVPMLDSIIAKYMEIDTWKAILANSGNPVLGAIGGLLPGGEPAPTGPVIIGSGGGGQGEGESEAFIPAPSGEGEEFAFHGGGVVPGIGNRMIMAQGGEIVARPIASPVGVGGGVAINGPLVQIQNMNVASDIDRESLLRDVEESAMRGLSRALGGDTPYPFGLKPSAS